MPRRRITRSVAALAVTGCVAGAGAVATAAATGAGATGQSPAGVFSLSPGDHELVAAPGAVLAPTLVRNTTSLTLAVRLIPVLVGQAPTGAFTFATSAADERSASRVLQLSTGAFDMRPHSEMTVLERWRPTARHHAANAAVVFRATPLGPTRGVRVIDQLLGLDLLGLRTDAPARGRIDGLLISDASAHRLRMAVALRNAGATFGTPGQVGVVVRAAGGRVAARVTMTPGVILPGVTRQFVAALPVRLAPGRYTAIARARLHGHVASVAQRFTVVTGGLLPEASLVPGAVHTTGTVGGRAQVTLTLRNAGTRPGAPQGTVSLYPVRAGVVARTAAASVPLKGDPLAPGAVRTLRVALGHLRGGPYEAIVRYAPPFAPTAPSFAGFTPSPSPSSWSSIRRFLAADGVIVLAGLVMLATFAYLVRRLRRAESRSRPGIRLRPLP